MFSFGTQGSKSTYGVVIDIGSGSVGVGVVASREGAAVPQLLFTHREYLRTTGAISKNRDVRMRKLREALFAALLVLNGDGLAALRAHAKHATIEKVLVTCSSPWSHTISRSISYDHEERDRITKGLIADLIASAEDEIANTLEESAIIEKLGLHVVERNTVDVRVNGYLVKDPVGLKGTTIDLSHITGLIPGAMLETIDEMHDKTFVNASISVHTYMLVAYCVMRDLFSEMPSFCIVDITSESTEIGIVEVGVLRETSHVPTGSHTLVRAVQEQTKGTHDDAVSLLRSHAEGTLAPSNMSVIKKALATYTESVGTVFDSLQKSRRIPLTMIVTADPELETLFSTLLPTTMESRSKSTYTALELRAALLQETAQTQNPDIFIALSSRFFHKLHGCGDLEMS
ncbi:MAG: hypothetical protein LR017_00570 [Candidatus Pacebacteria bacterium]|nr:hypothetical protein [Candidatus Paceibacterota bacterium]